MLRQRHFVCTIKIWKKAFSQNLAPMTSNEADNAGMLKKLGLTWLPSYAPGFFISSKKVHILYEPQSFYKLLLEQTEKAEHRIVLASLYLGNGLLEESLVMAVNKRLEDKCDLRVKILMDCIRGSRGKINSREMVMPLLRNHEKSCQVSLYQTPSLKGMFIPFLPEKYKEIVGLQHMKVYLFDCNCIITGANLSNDYFTKRQDRYMFISGCKELSDFIEGLVDTVSDFSFHLSKENKLNISNSWPFHPSETEPEVFYLAAGTHLRKYYDSFTGNAKTDEEDTIIFPLLEIGPFAIHVDSTVTMRLLQECDPEAFVHLTTGYFNLTEAYSSIIIKKSQARFSILMAHPTANGFYKAKGPAGGIPYGYTNIAADFIRKVAKSGQTSRVRMFEYKRRGWTYHAKGLWLSSSELEPPFLTMIGSPNFGERSLKRDLECQFLVATIDKDLRSELLSERNSFYDFSQPFTESTETEPERRPPFWVKINPRMLKNSESVNRNRLRDYDWNLVHVMGSSSLSNYQENFVTLILHLSAEAKISAKEPAIIKTISVELTRNELDKLILSLENCKQKLLKTN